MSLKKIAKNIKVFKAKIVPRVTVFFFKLMDLAETKDGSEELLIRTTMVDLVSMKAEHNRSGATVRRCDDATV